MFKSSLLLILSVLIVSEVSLPQSPNSVQINGGIISPMSSSKGLTGTIQYNYLLNPIIKFYAYTGYSAWDKHKIKFPDNRMFYSGYGPKYFDSYSADDHILIPFYLGTKINFSTTKFFTSYVNFEIGYSYLSYNSYEQQKVMEPVTEEVIGYHPDESTKKENQESLFGVGIGAGLSYPISESLDLLLSFKLNSYVNENYYGLFSARGTYTTFTAGFNFNL